MMAAQGPIGHGSHVEAAGRVVYPGPAMPQSKRRKPKATGPTQSRHPDVVHREPSPKWYVGLMIGLMAVGVLLVLARFVFQTEQWLLLVGLVMISVGFIMTTNYR